MEIRSRKNVEVILTFAEFATDHEEHAHCSACGGCILDPAKWVRWSAPIWCAGCYRRIDAALPPGRARPWMYGGLS